MISAALKPIIAISNPFSSAFLSYMSKMIGGSDYVSKLKSYMSAIKGQLKESNKRVASIDADNKKTAEKDALRTKARKSIILARNMIKKGLVAPQDEDAKIKELMEYEDKALNEIAKETANIKTSKVGGRKLLARIPSMSQDGDGLREVPTKKEVEGAQLWDTPKKVDEKNAVDYSKRGKK